MKFIRAAVNEVVGLFVADWTQTGISVVILAIAWLVLSRFHYWLLNFIIPVLIATQLVYATVIEARRRAAEKTA